MKKILFVDDDPHLLEGLERILLAMPHDWKMAFVATGPRAVDMLQQEHFDVVVSDIRMPGMDGIQLLAEVKRLSPDTIRFLLSGQTENELIYRSVAEAHQFLSKPCKPKLLKECVDRAIALRELLNNDSLLAMVAQLGTLPPVPEVYARLCEALKDSECSVNDVGRIIEMDQAMTAKILQVTNSAFFALRQQVSTAAHAVSLLGLDTVKALVLATGVFAPMEESRFPKGFSIDALWKHSMLVGAYARSICEGEEPWKKESGDAYTAGLLHDIGKLVFTSVSADDYFRVHEYAVANQVSLLLAEKAVLGCTHSEIGAYLLGIWGLPNGIVESVAYHHRPMESIGNHFSPLTAVHVADALARIRHNGPAEYPDPGIDFAYIDRLGLMERLPSWEEACTTVDARGCMP